MDGIKAWEGKRPTRVRRFRPLGRFLPLLLLALTVACSETPASPTSLPSDELPSPTSALDPGGTDDLSCPSILRFVGHESGLPYLLVDGAGVDEDIDPERFDFQPIRSVFHPRVRVEAGKGRTDLFTADPDSLQHLIYTPVLLWRTDGWDCLYGGWDLNQERRGSTLRGPVDRLYLVRIPDPSLGDWQVDPKVQNRRLVLESDSGEDGDPSLYHINDPSLVDLGNGRLRIYFEMESLNATDTFLQGPAGWTPPAEGEAGIPVHGIAVAESIDGGQNWTGLGGASTGKVDRRGYLQIDGISAADYAYHQIGWPSVVIHDGLYLMYFNIYHRRGTFPESGELTLAKSWSDFNNQRTMLESLFPPDHRFKAGNLHLAESEDGIHFTYMGEVRDENGSTVYAYNPDVALLEDGPGAIVVYNGQTYEWRTRYPKYPGQWALGVARLNLSTTASRLRLGFFAPDTVNSLDPMTMPFLPSLYEADRSDVTPMWIRRDGRILGIGYGQWKEPTLDDSWIAAAYIQKQVIVLDADGNVIADCNTAADLDTVQVSAAETYRKGVAWCVLHGNEDNPEGDRILEAATIEVWGIHGELLARKTGLRLAPGDRFEIVPQS